MTPMVPYRYCPRCAGILEKKKMDHKARLVCSKCRFIVYQNSKPCVGALVVEGNKVLLTSRGIEPYRGYWDLPGGFLEYGEEPQAGLKRELREELGLRAKVEHFLGAYIDRYGTRGDFVLTLYYLVTPLGNIKHAADDVSDYAYFPIDKPPKNLAFPSVQKVLQALRIGWSP